LWIEVFFFCLPYSTSGVGTTLFSSCCVELFLRPAACLTSPCNYSGYKGLQMHPGRTKELEIINFGQPSDDWPLRTLLSFRDGTPSALTPGPSTSSTTTYQSMMKNERGPKGVEDKLCISVRAKYVLKLILHMNNKNPLQYW
jgi:hypothetical protein